MWKIALIASSALALAALPSNAQWKTPWTYDGERGAEHWGALDPDYAACNAGHAQSPVDIKGAVKRPLPPLGFDYHAGPVSLINNGATAVRVDYPRGTGDLLKVGDRIYALTQFHFHHPSEETLNGQVFAMTLHLMHASADGRVAGVAIFLKPGKANPVVQALWDQMAGTPGPSRPIPGLSVDPSALLPAGRGYYAYQGSQTAPPCTEGVQWFVLKTPIEVSPAQIEAFARIYPHDVRPVQPLNGRVIEESE